MERQAIAPVIGPVQLVTLEDGQVYEVAPSTETRLLYYVRRQGDAAWVAVVMCGGPVCSKARCAPDCVHGRAVHAAIALTTAAHS